METRLSRNRTHLTHLAQTTGLQDYEGLSKPELNARLQRISQSSLDRSRRRQSRSEIHEMSSSSYSSSSSSSNSTDFGAALQASSSVTLGDESGYTTEPVNLRRGKKRSLDEVGIVSTALHPAASSSSSSSSKAGSKNDSTPFPVLSPWNKVDPIMLEPLKKKRHVWRYVRPGGTSRVAFNVDTLVDFLLSSGDFYDPVTRIAFTDADLADIDRAAIASGLKKPSVLEARKNPQAYADQTFRRDALEGLERCAGDVMANMLDLVEGANDFVADEAHMRLALVELPQFADYYDQLQEADVAYAKQAMEHWLQYIVGPPNKPYPDKYGLIDLILQCLKSIQGTRNGAQMEHHVFMAASGGESGGDY